ncbi:unnamed protein product [Camellia sinensis]
MTITNPLKLQLPSCFSCLLKLHIMRSSIYIFSLGFVLLNQNVLYAQIDTYGQENTK